MRPLALIKLDALAYFVNSVGSASKEHNIVEWAFCLPGRAFDCFACDGLWVEAIPVFQRIRGEYRATPEDCYVENSAYRLCGTDHGGRLSHCGASARRRSSWWGPLRWGAPSLFWRRAIWHCSARCSLLWRDLSSGGNCLARWFPAWRRLAKPTLRTLLW